MKKKTVLAMLVMCMVFSASACSDKSAEKSAPEKTESSAEKTDKAEEKTETKEDTKQEEEKTEVRLVSVSDISKYITVGEYKGLKLNNIVEPVSDPEVDTEIEFRLQDKAEEVKGGTAQSGDQVRVSFTGTIDGKSFEGGSEEDYDLVIGEGAVADGFDEGIVGMKAGETKELNLTFPEDYYDSELVGKSAVYQVTVQSIRRTPELTDEWVAANTDSKTVAEYRAAVQKELEDGVNEAAENQLYADAWNQVFESSEIIEYPEEDIDTAIEAYKELNGEYIEQAQMDMSEFLKSQGITEEEYEEDCRQYAEAKVKQNLIVQYIMDEENLSVDDKEAEALDKKLLQQYGATDISEVVDLYGEREVNETRALLRVEKFIVDQAEVDQKVGGGDELAENEDAVTEEGAYDTQTEDAGNTANEDVANEDAALEE